MELTIFDADAHVEEWAETFSDSYLDAAFRTRRPEVIVSGRRPYWLIEDNVFPKLFGRGCHMFGTPTGYGTQIDPTAGTKQESFESQELRDPAARIADLDRAGIAEQVLYPTLFVAAYALTSDPALEAGLYRAYNRWIADVTRRETRLHWVGVVTLTDVAAAVAEIAEIKHLGGIGVMTLGTVRDAQLDEPQFDPFFAALERWDLPLAVHVGWSSPALNNLFTYNYPAAVYPFRAQVQMAFLHLIAGGVLDRHPRLRVGFFEAGLGWVPYWLEIMESYWGLKTRKPGVPLMDYRAAERPMEYIRSGKLFFGIEEREWLFSPALQVVGENQVIWASDIPHADRDPDALHHFLEAPDLSGEQKRKLLWANGRRFYGLKGE